MSFKSWAIANPTKTQGYKRIQNSIGYYQRDIEKAQEALAKAEAGIMPDWATRERKPLFAGLPLFNTSEMFSRIMYNDIGLSEAEIDKKLKEDRTAKWEREAVEAEEREREHKEIALKVEKEHRQDDIDRCKKHIAELEQELTDYKVDESLFTWNRWDDYDFVQRCLAARLTVLGITESVDMDLEFDDTIETIAVKLGVNCSLFYSTRRGRWIAKVEDDSVSFTRFESTIEYNGAMVAAFMYALLKYLDYKWDELVEKHAS